MKTVREFPDADGLVAIFDEAPGGGDPTDINSLRNRPALDPASWLERVYFHTSLDNMEVFSDTTLSVAHGSVAALATTTTAQSRIDFAYTPVETVLGTHGLGYPPFALVAIGNQVITPGYIVQTNAAGAARFVSVYVTTSQVVLREWAQRGEVALAATSFDYRTLVFKKQPAPSGNKALNFDPDTGILTLARNRFDSSRRYLQVVPGGTPFGLATGRTLDLANGTVRFVSPDGTIHDPVPSTTKMRFYLSSYGSYAFGDPMNYTGSFAGDPSILVQAP